MARIRWTPSYRLVPSRFPPVGLFDRVARPEDLEFVLAAESLTNDRLRDEAGDLHLVPRSERISGAGTTPIMAAFTHVNREGSRFSDGTYGVYYAAKELDTALAESAYHRGRFLARTAEPACEIDVRLYLADIATEVVDVRGRGHRKPDLMNATSYAESAPYGRTQREKGANGIVYDSVRRAGGTCVAIFRPKAVSPCRQGAHLCLIWDGRAITGWYEKSGLKNA